MPKTRGGRTQRILAVCKKLFPQENEDDTGNYQRKVGQLFNEKNKENQNWSDTIKNSEDKENDCNILINSQYQEQLFVPPVANEFQTFFNNNCDGPSSRDLQMVITEINNNSKGEAQIFMNLGASNNSELIQSGNGNENKGEYSSEYAVFVNSQELEPIHSVIEFQGAFDQIHINPANPGIDEPELNNLTESDSQVFMDLEVPSSNGTVASEGKINDWTLPMNSSAIIFEAGLPDLSQNMFLTNSNEEQINDVGYNRLINETINKGKAEIENEKPYATAKVKIRKRNRNSGKEYVTAKGIIKKARVLKPLRADCRNKCSNILNEETRQAIFDEYWSLGEYDRRIAYVAGLVNAYETKITRRKVEGKAIKNRTHSFVYNLAVNGSKHIVCKTCFLNTLGETEKFLTVALSKKLSSTSGITELDKRGKHTPKHKTPQFKINEVNEHILSFPAYESHYSRRHTNKKYLAPSLNLNTMYKLYCEKYQKPVSIKIYSQEFHKTGLKFKKPKIDTCTRCDTFHAQIKIANSAEEKQDLNYKLLRHQECADLAYKTKEEDKEKGFKCASYVTYTFDLQQVLPTPYLSTNKMFYLRQLSTYNLTVHNCISGDSSHFMWPESTAGRGANEVASCLFRFIQSIPQGVKTANFYSDTCGGQNKNFHVMSMFQYAINIHSSLEEINHKFLIPGHTHMECDVDHSVIERAKKKSSFPIQVPRDWYQLVRSASKKNKFDVFVMEREHMFAFSEMVGKGPFQKKTFKMRDVCWLRYVKSNEKVQYKFSLSEEEEFKGISFFRKGSKLQNLKKYKLNCFYSGPKPINPKKKENLMEIVNLLDKDVQDFYRNLKTEKTITRDTDPDIDRYFSDDDEDE